MLRETTTSGSTVHASTAESPPSLSDIARTCLEQAGGDWQRAAQLMRAAIEDDPAMLRQLVSPLIDTAIWQYIRKVSHTFRREVQQQSHSDVTGIHAVAASEEKKWLDKFLLSGGMPLGDAKKDKLSQEAQWHRTLIESSTAKAEFFQAIAKRIGDKCVRDVLTNEQIDKIWKRISQC